MLNFLFSLNVENKLLTCVCDFFVNFFRLGLWFSIYIIFFSAVKNNNILWDRDFAYFLEGEFNMKWKYFLATFDSYYGNLNPAISHWPNSNSILYAFTLRKPKQQIPHFGFKRFYFKI